MDEDVSWDDIRLVVAILISKYGTKDNRIQWSEQERKAVLEEKVGSNPSTLNEDAPKCNPGTFKDSTPSKSESSPPLGRSLSTESSTSCEASKKRVLPAYFSENSLKDKENLKKKLKKNSLFK